METRDRENDQRLICRPLLLEAADIICLMIMVEGQVYRCQNRQCGAEVKVISGSVEGGANPRCCCGAEMKKPYTTPTLKRLDPTPELVNLLARRGQ